ncbi:LysR family transcriptional regulator [Streptomyces albidoflavus]|uniref:LysR family transcriptional regulator n=1 Tax=Streptomyces albidoflavus TaxID=1886 RepID=UPI0038D1A6B8
MPERLGLEAFLVLAEELHFGRTAERLHVTTGRISQVLKKLEARVGAPLFERDSRIVTLTKIGGQLREDLQSGYGQIERGLARATDAASGGRGAASGAGGQRVPVAGGMGAALVAEVLSSALPFAAGLLALRRVPSHPFGVWMSVNPVFAALIGWVVLGEGMTGPAGVAVGVDRGGQRGRGGGERGWEAR